MEVQKSAAISHIKDKIECHEIIFSKHNHTSIISVKEVHDKLFIYYFIMSFLVTLYTKLYIVSNYNL